MALYTSRICFRTTESMLSVVRDSKLNQKIFDGYASKNARIGPRTYTLVKKEYITPLSSGDFRVDRENFIQDTFSQSNMIINDVKK